MPKINFQPDGKKVTVNKGETILRAAAKARVYISQKCGGNASCTTCRVHLLTPKSFTPPNPREKRRLTEEQLAQNIRLACQTLILNDGELEKLPSHLLEIITKNRIEGDND